MKTNGLIINWAHNPKEGRTHCTINEESNPADEPIGIGWAMASDNDQYCRETGRKVSLTRALNEAGLQKEVRAAIWEDYRTFGKIRWGSEVTVVDNRMETGAHNPNFKTTDPVV